MSSHPLPDGLYEAMLSSELEQSLLSLGNAATVEPIDAAHQPHVLARHIYDATRRALSATPDPARRVTMVNELLTVLQAQEAEVSAPARQLKRISRPGLLGASSLSSTRPSTPLAEPALLTNTRGEPNLGSELRAEIDTSNEVDLLCAFVKWHGLRLLETELSRLRDREAPLRVLTTTYMGATERRALDRLVNDFGAEVRIQYDAARTRLHAKKPPPKMRDGRIIKISKNSKARFTY